MGSLVSFCHPAAQTTLCQSPQTFVFHSCSSPDSFAVQSGSYPTDSGLAPVRLGFLYYSPDAVLSVVAPPHSLDHTVHAHCGALLSSLPDFSACAPVPVCFGPALSFSNVREFLVSSVFLSYSSQYIFLVHRGCSQAFNVFVKALIACIRY